MCTPPLPWSTRGLLQSNSDWSNAAVISDPSYFVASMILLVLPLVAYTSLLAVLATVSPGVGWLGQLLLIIPAGLLDAFHAPAYGILAWMILSALLVRGWPRRHAVLAGCVLAVTLGLWTEALQGPVSGRGPELKDLIMDGIGAAMAALIALTFPSFSDALPINHRTEGRRTGESNR